MFVSLNVKAVKVAAPARFQSFSDIDIEAMKQGELSAYFVDSVEHYAFYVFVNALKDQDIEWVFIDQKQKAEALLYESEVVASLFLFENKNELEKSKSSHFSYSSAIIEKGKWRKGLFTCQPNKIPKSIALTQTDSSIIDGLNKQLPTISVSLHKSWPSILNKCVNESAAIMLPMAMKNQKIMNNQMYFTDVYVQLPYSYHIVFSSQGADAKKLKAKFENILPKIIKPLQMGIQ